MMVSNKQTILEVLCSLYICNSVFINHQQNALIIRIKF